MTRKTIDQVQQYLTVIEESGDRVHQIVNVQLLLRKHPPDAVMSFLKQLHKEYGKTLAKLLRENRSDSRINELVARRFRIKMAINTIRQWAKQMEAA